MAQKYLTLILAAAGMSGLGACQTTSEEAHSAVLADGTPEEVETVRSAIGVYLGQASVRLGPGDLTEISTVSALPAPLNPNEDRSTAVPVQFNLMIKDGQCFLEPVGSEEQIQLDGVACAAVGDG